uniref:uncharacterized protein LOC101311581 n=1 Tax=Fragaria vesca subsp. vesca TaxID=101020 RepID=UPI0005C9336C|nr:PREDICTED: uncharacterized protein LOC101311581 [Fragaria vesca subsp. vesca]
MLQVRLRSKSLKSTCRRRLEKIREQNKMVVGRSTTWAYVRIISGTILGGALGFYVMDRLEKSYKEKMNERLRKYQNDLKMKEEKVNEFAEESL